MFESWKFNWSWWYCCCYWWSCCCKLSWIICLSGQLVFIFIFIWLTPELHKTLIEKSVRGRQVGRGRAGPSPSPSIDLHDKKIKPNNFLHFTGFQWMGKIRQWTREKKRWTLPSEGGKKGRTMYPNENWVAAVRMSSEHGMTDSAP